MPARDDDSRDIPTVCVCHLPAPDAIGQCRTCLRPYPTSPGSTHAGPRGSTSSRTPVADTEEAPVGTHGSDAQTEMHNAVDAAIDLTFIDLDLSYAGHPPAEVRDHLLGQLGEQGHLVRPAGRDSLDHITRAARELLGDLPDPSAERSAVCPVCGAALGHLDGCTLMALRSLLGTVDAPRTWAATEKLQQAVIVEDGSVSALSSIPDDEGDGFVNIEGHWTVDPAEMSTMSVNWEFVVLRLPRKAVTDCAEPADGPRRDIVADLRADAGWENGQPDDGLLWEAAAEIERLRALVGGRPAAPDREPADRVDRHEAEVILAGLLNGTDHPTCDSCRSVMRQAHTLIVALLSRSAAPDREQVRGALANCTLTDQNVPEWIDLATDAVVALLSRSAAEPPPSDHQIDALLERVDAWVESVDGTPAPWTLVGDMADLLRRWRGVAAEPDEEPTDGE